MRWTLGHWRTKADFIQGTRVMQHRRALLAEGAERMKSQVHSLPCLGKERECLGPEQRQEKGVVSGSNRA